VLDEVLDDAGEMGAGRGTQSVDALLRDHGDDTPAVTVEAFSRDHASDLEPIHQTGDTRTG
jgi:hypothetical protein